jgi:predicted small secreted protein
MRLIVLAISLLLSACATTPGSGLQVDTVSGGQPLPGANCVVSNGRQSWNLVTPAALPLVPAAGNLRVWCDKAGYRTSELVLQGTASDPWWGPAVGLGISGGSHGHTGVGLGLSFPLFGSPRSSYPGRVIVEMSPQ